MSHDLTASQLALVKRTIASDCNPGEFDFFMATAKSYDLDPFRNQIIPVIFNKDKPDKRRMSIIVTRDGFRVIAQRCGDYRPASEPAEIDYSSDLIGPDNPKGIVSATVYLWKRDTSGEWFKVVGVADWDEFAPIENEWAYDKEAGARRPTGKKTVTGNWAKMPKAMITKCAEGQALRAGWPDQMGGLYVEEEMDGALLSDMTASQAVDAEAQRNRDQMVGVGKSILVALADNDLERVPIGEFFDAVMEHIKQLEPAKVDEWRVRNREPLKEFWAAHPSDALALKKEIERLTANIKEGNTQ